MDTIKQIILYWEGAYADSYTVQISDNAIVWTDIYDEFSGDGDIDNTVVVSTNEIPVSKADSVFSTANFRTSFL